jgi:hypothetical protein
MPQDSPPPGREQLRGQYANYFVIGHNVSEFVLDFGQAYAADEPDATEHIDVHTRLITSPVSARALSRMLRESLASWDRAYGHGANAEPEGPEP